MSDIEMASNAGRRAAFAPRSRAATRGFAEARRVSPLLEKAGLTPEQDQVVRHPGGPLLVFAGPGTGKTRTLTYRIAYLIEQRLAWPQRILAMTFTRRATDEMRASLAGVLDPRPAREVTVWTTHQLCLRMVRGHAHHYGRNGNLEVRDRAAMTRLARAILRDPAHAELADAHARCDAPAVESLLDEIGLAKNLLWTASTYRERCSQAAAPVTARLWELLDQRLRADNAFDLDDLLVYAADLLARHPDVRDSYRERYEHILIDEFQDLNPAQLEITRQLMAPDRNLAAFADDDQSLYGFRGADPHAVLRFTEDYPSATTITLTENHRSYAEIVDASRRLIEQNHRRAPKAIIAKRGPGGYASARRLPSDEAEAEEVAALIIGAIRSGRDPTEILVLARTSEPLRRLQTWLVAAGLRVRLVGGLSLWERSEIKDAIAHLTVLANPYDAETFTRALTAPTDRRPFRRGAVAAPSRGIGQAGAAAIIAFARERRVDLITAGLRASQIPGLNTAQRQALRDFARALDAIGHEHEGPGGARSISSLVERTLHIPGGPIASYELLRDQAQERRVRADANRVLEDLRSLARSAARYEESTLDEEPSVTGLLEALGVEATGELDADHDDRVTLSTIHAAKGLQAMFVITIAAEEGLIPHRRQSQSTDGLEEERRLLYTALTRASDTALFTWTDSRGGEPTDGPSRFLREAGLRR